ncbi:MAG TPA: fasciclin domain-containing protein [Elainellaceae cyanobacterium]
MAVRFSVRRLSDSKTLAIALLVGASSVLTLSASSLAYTGAEIESSDSLKAELNQEMHISQAPGTIVEVASGSDAFETLVQAVQAADLVDTLSGDGPYTVFAPTDDAFANLPDGALDALLLPENQDLLTDILTYHVVPGEVTSDELETGAVDSLNGGLAVQVDPDGVVVNDASVIQPDIDASNGVIHAINRVLIPPSVQPELEALLAEEEMPETEPEMAEPTETGTTEAIPALW